MKTLSIIDNFLKVLNEQDVDAAAVQEPQQPVDAAGTPDASISAIGDTGGESYLIDLAVNAFIYGSQPGKPTESELKMVIEAYKAFKESQPNKVAATLEEIMKLGNSGDTAVSDLLTNS
jgi:hypothetical protein